MLLFLLFVLKLGVKLEKVIWLDLAGKMPEGPMKVGREVGVEA